MILRKRKNPILATNLYNSPVIRHAWSNDDKLVEVDYFGVAIDFGYGVLDLGKERWFVTEHNKLNCTYKQEAIRY